MTLWPGLRRAGVGIAIVGVAAAAVVMGHAILRDPDVAFLVPRRGAEWIRYPHGPRAGTRPAVELATTFTQSFVLSSAPERAGLTLVAFRSPAVRINGREVELPLDRGSWKAPLEIEVSGYLRPGENLVEVAVANDRGPPALWLLLRAGEAVLPSDASWRASLAGATWRHAVAAAEPMSGTRVDPEVADLRPVPALLERAPTLVLYAVLALLVAGAGEIVAWRLRRVPESRRRSLALLMTAIAVAVVAGAWVALLWNNAPSLSAVDGYDAEAHWEYVTFIQETGRLPRADQGWSMFQPPLYYALAAATLGVAGVTTDQAAAAAMLRAASIPLAVAQLLFLFGALRLVFPGRPGAALAGLGIGAFASGLLLQFQLIGNDALAATLSSAGIFLAILALDRDRPVIWHYLGIGLLLGLAMLAKATAVTVVAVVVATIAVAAPMRGRSIGEGLRSTGLILVAFLATCGWHFIGVWRRFGHPLVGNWDAEVLPVWWQDPGYVTPGFFLRWGASLREPFLSAFGGLQDGVYTTLWGDGLISGRTGIWIAPPWDWEGMAAGYLLALVPSVLIVLGAAVVVLRLLRRPSSSGWMVVGLGVVSLAALAVWPARLPVYSVIKAAFALPAIVTLCAFAGAGFEAVTARSRIVRLLIVVVLGTWIANTYATLWIPRDDPGSLSRLAWLEAAGAVGSAGAVARFAPVLKNDSSHPLHRLAMARHFETEGRRKESADRLRGLLEDHPEMDRARWRLAYLLEQLEMPDEAVEQYRQVLSRVPGSYAASLGLGRILRSRGEFEEATHLLRQALVTIPDLGEPHYELGLALEGMGRREEAALELATAARLDPGSTSVLERALDGGDGS